MTCDIMTKNKHFFRGRNQSRGDETMRDEQKIHVYRTESSTAERGVYPPHLHSFYEILYVEEGVIAITLNGRKMTASAGSLLFFDRMAMHDIFPQQLPYRRICVQIASNFWNVICADARLACLWIRSSDPMSAPLYLTEHTACIAAIERILTEYSHDGGWNEQAAGYAFGLFLTTFLREFPNFLRTDLIQVNHKLLEAKRYIEEHCQKEIRIDTLAGQLYFSSGYFIQSFKRVTGTTPKRYQMLCRLATARTLLLSTHLSVADIALQVGFHDANGFIRFFRKEMRLTPGQFRRRAHGDELTLSRPKAADITENAGESYDI